MDIHSEYFKTNYSCQYSMHEWALAESIVDTSLNAAEKEGLKKLTMINIEIGELQQINKEIFHYAINEILNSRGKDADKITITITIIKSTLQCHRCQYEWKFSEIKNKLSDDDSESIHFIPEVAFVHSRCPNCGSFDFKIKSGRGITIKSIKGEK